MLARLFIWAMIGLTVVTLVHAVPARVHAQEEGGAAEGEAAPEGEVKMHKSYFMWFIESSGLIGLVILILSIYFIAQVIKLFMELRPQLCCPPEDVARMEELLEARDFKSVYQVAQESDTFLGRVLTAAISELPGGLADAREALDRAGEAEAVDMERKISMLAVLGTLGPMIGLLGTLKGMIASFSVIALSDTQLKSSEVAGGISEALLLTFEGVGLSVPAIFFFAFFRNRVSSITARTMLEADHLLRKMAQLARMRGPGAGAAPAAAAAAQPVRPAGR